MSDLFFIKHRLDYLSNDNDRCLAEIAYQLSRIADKLECDDGDE